MVSTDRYLKSTESCFRLSGAAGYTNRTANMLDNERMKQESGGTFNVPLLP